MGKKNSKQVKVRNSSPILPLLIIVLLVYFGFNFLTKQSNMNISRKNDALYEQNLKNQNYAYMDDIRYKKDIVKQAKKYSLHELDFVMGPQELKNYIEKYDNTPSAYAYERYNPVGGTYLKDKTLRANLNVHTIKTDGHMEVKEILDQAAEYADAVAIAYPTTKFIIGFADKDSLDNAPEIIDTVRKEPDKYKNIKVVFGIEISTTLESNDLIDESSKVSLLALGVNPFDKTLLRNFPRQSLFTSYENISHDFDDIVTILNEQNYLIYGIAKPLQYFDSVSDKYNYLKNLFEYYNTQENKYKFIEAYYDPYTYSRSPEINQMNELSTHYRFHKVGSLSDYGDNLFEY